MSKLQVSRKGFDLIQSFEGFRAKAAKLKDGGFTVGFGHKTTARDGMVVNREQAEELLRWDIAPIEDAIRQNVFAPMNQNQFDALASFVFNIGIEEFKASEVLKHLNQGEFISAAIELGAWRRAHINGQQIVVDALVRRRTQEAALFLETIGPRPAAPSPIVRPLLDYGASLLAPNPENIKRLEFASDSTDPAIKDIESPKPQSKSEAIGLGDEFKTKELSPFPSDFSGVQIDSELPKIEAEEILPIADAKIEEIEAANNVQEEAIEVANDLESVKSSETLEAIEQESKTQILPKKKRFSIDPFSGFVIFAGLVAFAIGAYETYAQGILKNGLFSAELSANQIFVLMTTIVGFVAAVLATLGLFAEDGE